jgi:hypothetical protein
MPREMPPHPRPGATKAPQPKPAGNQPLKVSKPPTKAGGGRSAMPKK